MFIIKHILFPFDFSKQAELVSPFVRTVSSHFGAQITLLGVVPLMWSVPPIGMSAMVDFDTRELEQDLQSRLDSTLAKDWTNFHVKGVTKYGDPAMHIIEYAESNSVDLIMMPTHGCGLLRSLLIGSVTAKVLHDAEIPVWTAAHAEEQQSPSAPGAILCAVDDHPKSAELMQWSAEFARGMGATLSFVHVIPRISDWLELPSERDLQEEMRKEALEKIDALRRSAHIETPVRLVVGEVTDAVTEEARREEAGLVIIGRGSLQSRLGRLRTHAYGIIQKSPCPVLSV